LFVPPGTVIVSALLRAALMVAGRGSFVVVPLPSYVTAVPPPVPSELTICSFLLAFVASFDAVGALQSEEFSICVTMELSGI